jgi:hypothetical protein
MTESQASHGSFWMRCAGSTPRDRANLRRVLWTYLGWAVLFAGGSQLLKRHIVPDGPPSWAIAALPILAAVLVIRAYARFLREADELHRAIHLEAMALGFGGGFLGVSCYRVLERVGAPPAGIEDATIFLSLFFAVGIVRSTWGYR